jgi:hypothetical protein
MGPRAGLDGQKVSSPPGFDPGDVRPARSRSLYRLSYRAHQSHELNNWKFKEIKFYVSFLGIWN